VVGDAVDSTSPHSFIGSSQSSVIFVLGVGATPVGATPVGATSVGVTSVGATSVGVLFSI